MLKELAKVSSPKLIPGSLEAQYYALLVKDVEEEEIERTLSFNNNNHFRQIKFRLKRKLLDAVITQNSNNEGAALEEMSDAYKLFSAGRIMMLKQAHQAGVELLEKALNKALRQQMIGLALECAQPLSTYFSTLSGVQKKYLRYQDLVDQLLERQLAETKCRSYYNRVSHAYTHQWHDTPEIAFEACKAMKPLIGASIIAANAYYSSFFIAHIAAQDYQGLIKICDESLEYFSQFPSAPRSTIYSAYLKKAIANIHLGKYSEALKCTKDVIRIAEKGKYSYCSACFYKGITGLHSGDIHITLDAIDQVTPYLDALPETFQEQWKILEAYAALFSSRKFKIGRFINEVPIFNKDKAGANAAIIVVQMLHYIKDGRTNDYIERCAALERYTSRYLKGKARTLAKLLLEVSKGHFNATTVQYRTKRLVKDLEKAERELEIIPASKIWVLVLEWLK